MPNATGWAELINGSMLKATYTLYNAALAGWFVAILFLVFQALLYIKTRNITLMFITALFFAAMFVTAPVVGAVLFVETSVYHVLYVILAFELAGILFMWFWK